MGCCMWTTHSNERVLLDKQCVLIKFAVRSHVGVLGIIIGYVITL